MRLLIVSTSILALFAIHVLAHSHSHEAPHLKYGREVNEAAQRDEKTVSHHGHSHSHDDEEDDHLHHGHAHSHFHDDEEDDHLHHGHAHSHGSHGHSHEHGADCGHAHGEAKKAAATKEFKLYDKKGYFARLNDPSARLWAYSLGATFFISAIPCIILAFISIEPDSDNSSKLKILLALGAGGLLGDVFLHLLPHAQEARESISGGHGHSHSHGHSHGDGDEPHVHDSFIGLWVLGGLLFFFVAEKFARIVSGGDSHGHSHGPPSPTKKPAKKSGKKAKKSDDESAADTDYDTDHERRPLISHDDDEEARTLRAVSILNLLSDFLHNFTDGLAIGASFITGVEAGIWTTFMVFVHEIPHELGDFALQVRSGRSKLCAMLLQLLTAVGAFIGCAVAVNSVDGQKWGQDVQSSWVMPFTAGGFIYIATVTVLPDLLKKSTFWLTVGEVLAMSVGVVAMYLIGFLEHVPYDEALAYVKRFV